MFCSLSQNYQHCLEKNNVSNLKQIVWEIQKQPWHFSRPTSSGVGLLRGPWLSQSLIQEVHMKSWTIYWIKNKQTNKQTNKQKQKQKNPSSPQFFFRATRSLDFCVSQFMLLIHIVHVCGWIVMEKKSYVLFIGLFLSSRTARPTEILK